jgi:glutathione S-transferase
MTDLDAVRGAAFGPERQDEAGVATKPVTLVQFPHVWGRNISPFALKLEAWLKLADIPFDVRTSTRFGKAPKGKLPYILDEGRPIGDSTLIIEHLKATRGIDPDESLGPPERAQALALQRLVEEHLYFAVVYSRWVDEEGWPLFADAVFGRLRQPLRRAGEFWYREHVRKMLHLQGLGRHSRDEIYALARADLEAMAELLGDKPFFMGDRITTVDAVAYGCLANILLVPLETELKRIAAGLPSLGAWCEAMEQGLRSDSEGSGSP